MQATIDRLRQRREQKGEGGFTLIELLIVIVILGILAAIVVFAVQNLTGSSSKAACGSDYKTVETAVEAYNAQVGHYPSAADATAANYTSPVTEPSGDTVDALMAANGGSGPWLKDFPANGSHYQITVSSSGAVGVANTDGSAVTGNSCSGVS